MLHFNIKVGDGRRDRTIGRIEIVNLRATRPGNTRYLVRFVRGSTVIETHVTHRRIDGAVKLISKATAAAHKAIVKFYSVPQGSIRRAGNIPEGCMLFWDEKKNGEPTGNGNHFMEVVIEVPKRYRKDFAKDCPVMTGMVYEGKAVIYLSDVLSWCQSQINGIRSMWD